MSLANNIVINDKEKIIYVTDEKNNCTNCRKQLELGLDVFMCEISKFLWCRDCVYNYNWHCPDRFKRHEHIEFLGTLTKKVRQ